MQANYSRSTNDRDALRPAVLRGGGGALAWTELPPRAMAATWPPCMHHVMKAVSREHAHRGAASPSRGRMRGVLESARPRLPVRHKRASGHDPITQCQATRLPEPLSRMALPSLRK